MATGDTMTLCPTCGIFYYINRGHDCPVLRPLGNPEIIGKKEDEYPTKLCPNCEDVSPGQIVYLDHEIGGLCTLCHKEVRPELLEGRKNDSGKPDAYKKLRSVLEEAVLQASEGKGKERHAMNGEAFEDQQICEITRRLRMSPVAGALFQVIKKVYESSRLPRDRAIAELRGAINYIAAAIIVLEEQKTEE